MADQPSPHLSGLVLTLDPWLRMTHGQDEVILTMARDWCRANDAEIQPQDECPVGFTHVGDLEALFHTTDRQHGMRTLHTIANRVGWGANELGVNEEAPRVNRPFVFRERMVEVIPWLDRLDVPVDQAALSQR